MPVNWKHPDAFTRLLAAMVAAQDMKLDYKKIASFYGKGATYDSIEGRFRLIKKEALALRAELDSGSRPEAPPRGALSTPKKSKSTLATPKKERIIGGRVVKNGGTPSRKRGGGKGIKEEVDSGSSSFVEAPSTEEEEGGAGVGNGGVEGDGLNLYYEDNFVGDSMDIGAF